MTLKGQVTHCWRTRELKKRGGETRGPRWRGPQVMCRVKVGPSAKLRAPKPSGLSPARNTGHISARQAGPESAHQALRTKAFRFVTAPPGRDGGLDVTVFVLWGPASPRGPGAGGLQQLRQDPRRPAAAARSQRPAESRTRACRSRERSGPRAECPQGRGPTVTCSQALTGGALLEVTPCRAPRTPSQGGVGSRVSIAAEGNGATGRPPR